MIVRLLIGAVIGAALGFGYYRLIGCASGACPITGNPYASSIYGAVVGILLAAR